MFEIGWYQNRQQGQSKSAVPVRSITCISAVASAPISARNGPCKHDRCSCPYQYDLRSQASVRTALTPAIPWGRSCRGMTGAANPESSVLHSTNGRIVYLCDDWCVWRTDLGARRSEKTRQRSAKYAQDGTIASIATEAGVTHARFESGPPLRGEAAPSHVALRKYPNLVACVYNPGAQIRYGTGNPIL